MMITRKVAPLCLAIGLGLAGHAAAAPSASGPTGQLEIPTADVAEHNVLTAALAERDGHVSGSVGFGLYPGVEVGVLADPASDGRVSVDAFGKLALSEEGAGRAGLALGFDGDAVYGVLSKALTRDLRLSVGYGTGWMDGAFGGVTLVLNPVTIERQDGFPLPSTTAMLDVIAGHVDAGVRMTFNPNFHLDLGLRSQLGAQGLADINLVAGASLSTAL